MTDNGAAYFSISTDGIRKIYRSAYTGGTHQTPEQIRLDVPDSVGVGNPLIAPGERFLLFTSAQLPGMGSADIYVAGPAARWIVWSRARPGRRRQLTLCRFRSRLWAERPLPLLHLRATRSGGPSGRRPAAGRFVPRVARGGAALILYPRIQDG